MSPIGTGSSKRLRKALSGLALLWDEHAISGRASPRLLLSWYFHRRILLAGHHMPGVAAGDHGSYWCGAVEAAGLAVTRPAWHLALWKKVRLPQAG
jgi:hypothetical protein